MPKSPSKAKDATERTEVTEPIQKFLSFASVISAASDLGPIVIHDLKGLREAGAVGRIERTDRKGRRHIYEFCPEVSLRSDAKVKVNWFSYRLINEDGGVGYENSWITDLRVTAQNVEELVEAGRSRWKIENENFNTLKNQGYHIEHNFGHGKKPPVLCHVPSEPSCVHDSPDP